jgi:hypothetical protein
VSYYASRAKDSDEAHEAARSCIYPQLWPGRQIRIESAVGSDLDYDHGIDYVVRVPLPGCRYPLRITIQERFRDPELVEYFRDVTITEANTDTGNEAELSKIGAKLFIYGAWDSPQREFRWVLACYADRIIYELSIGRLPFERIPSNGKGQSFIAIKWRELSANGCVALAIKVARDEQIIFEQLPNGQLMLPRGLAR